MKFINSFNISKSDLQKTTTTRPFNIQGDANAVFDLKITNSAGKFYNFITQTFETNVKTSTTSVTSDLATGSVVYITAVNSNIKTGMTVTGNGISEKVTVANVDSQEITLNGSVDVASGATLTFTAVSGLNAQELNNSGSYNNNIVFPTVSSNDVYTVLLEASIANGTELTKEEVVIDSDSTSSTYGEDITEGFTNKLFKSITINQYVDTTITINASSPALTALDVNYSSNSFTIVKPRNFEASGGFKTSFSWTFTTTSASAITKSQTLTDTYFETTKTQTVNGATSSSKTVVLDSVENLVVGMFISGTNFPGGDTILSIDADNKKITIPTSRSAVDGSTLTFTGKGSLGPTAYGTTLSFTNLTATLTPLTVTVASASSDSTTLVLNSAAYIQDGSTTIIKGPGIDVSETATSITTRAAGSDTITLSAAKSVEAGQTLTIEGSSSAVTITGDVMLTKMGDTDFTSTLQIDDFIGIGVS